MTIQKTPSDAPVWDLASYFPSFGGPEYEAHFASLESRAPEMARRASALGGLETANAGEWAAWVVDIEAMIDDYSHLASYIGCNASCDAGNEAFAAAQGRLSRFGAGFKKAMIPFAAALKDASDEAFEALAADPRLEGARYFLELERDEARYTMEPSLEELAADLGVDGMSAWGRLYNTIAGKLSFEMRWPDGRAETVPMARRNSLMDDPDPAVRQAAFDGGNAAWAGVEDSVAACLNGISGARLTLYERRGVGHFLDAALRQAHVSRASIDAMWSVAVEFRPLLHRYLRAKAKLMGKDRLGFQDTACTLPFKDSKRISWTEGSGKVFGAFRAAYPRLADFSAEMLAGRRIEAQVRPGKRPGAFCTHSDKTREARVYMSYDGSLGDMQTLAHELGHAFHCEAMRDLRTLACDYPMTLAETASTFAEDILCRALLEDPAADEVVRARILVEQLDRAVAFLLNIHMRYLFEERLYTERAKGEVGVSRLKAMMLDAQRECYGDALADDGMDPMFWASKLHFYITGVSFYNYPYTFGYLFSRGLSARFREEGPSFLPKYEELLRLTGSASAEEVARASIGADITGPGFWRQALDGLGEQLAQFEELAPKAMA